MKRQIKEATFKLIEALLEEWMQDGDEKYMKAVKDIMEIIKGLK